MRGGFSGAKGFMFYDTESNLAVYGSYNNEEKTILTGTVEEIKQLVTDQDNSCKKDNHGYDYIMGGLLILMICIVILSKIFGSFLLFLSSLIFCVLSYFSLLVILFSWNTNYLNVADYAQFRRYHGAEHKAVRLIFKSKEATMENLEKQSHFDPECGTAYAGMWTMLSFIVAVLVYHFPSLGILKFLLYLLIGVVLLVLNVFNPLNPFKLLQYKAVLKPTQRELDLALDMIIEFYKIHEKNLSD